MAIIKQYHKDTDTTYVYDSKSYFDEATQKYKTKRKVIGKIDPKTGEIVPTGNRGRAKRSDNDTDSNKEKVMYENIKAEMLGLRNDNKALKEEIDSLNKRIKELTDIISKVNSLTSVI